MDISCGKCGEHFTSVEGARRHKCRVKNPPSILQTKRPSHKVTTVDLSNLFGKESKPMMIIENRFRQWVGILASIFLGMTFVVASSGKLLTPVVEAEIPQIFLILLIMVELGVGILLVAGVFVKPAASFSLFLVTCFIISNILMKMLGMEECLSCFGAMGKLSTTQALMIDGIMVALAITILVFYPGRFFNKRPWYWGK